ncbi:YgzB family protein [Thalassobacillus devorans]|uniref:YgzB family protein n=1 Tax=Thalassobacillus devorans TaxID=279813 RepID=UPI00048CAE0F|nr:YgzB family protein [Thalassobacillus devorans]
MALQYSSKINKIRSFALGLVFAGFGIMYIGLLFKQTEWLMIIFMILGMLAIGLSTVVYFWIGMLSTKTIQIICPNCDKPTKMLGRVDACMHCKQPLTLDKSLEGKEFDEKYNSKRLQKKEEQS